MFAEPRWAALLERVMTPVDGPASRLKETERSLRWLAAVIIFNVVLSTSFQTAMFLTNHQKPDIPLALSLIHI